MEVLIKKAQLEDLTEILELQKSAYLAEAILYDDFNIPPLNQRLEELIDEYQNGIVVMAVSNSVLVGSVRAQIKDDTCHIDKLMVRDTMQNKGIGKLLMKAIEIEAIGVKRFELFTGNKSLKNLLLYEKLGYKRYNIQEIHERLSLVFLEKLNRL